MVFYKKIKLQNFDIIQKKCLGIIKQYNDVFYRTKGTSYYEVDHEEFLLECPELFYALKEYNMTCAYAAVYMMYNENHTKIHNDKYVHRCRLNLPILNAAGTYTLFYKDVKYYDAETTVGLKIGLAVDQTLKPCDSVEMDSPAIIAVQEAHSTLMPKNHPAPRIVLSLGMYKDPDYLLYV